MIWLNMVHCLPLKLKFANQPAPTLKIWQMSSGVVCGTTLATAIEMEQYFIISNFEIFKMRNDGIFYDIYN